VFVLCLFPIVPLLILDRDDVPDSLMWSGFISLIGVLAYWISLLAKKP